MGNRVIFVFDRLVQEQLDKEDMVNLIESLRSFIDQGLIDCEDDQEFHIDSEYLQDLVGGINALQKANKKYGSDDNGLIKYQFKE